MPMSNKTHLVGILIAALAAGTSAHPEQKKAGTKHQSPVEFTRSDTAVLWRAPHDIASRNLFYGPGGESHHPGRIFTFVKEDLKGSNPKFVVEDENRQRWKVKLGDEARPETAASRLVWAIGFFADEDYFMGDLQVKGLTGHLSRGQNLVDANGSVHSARLEREAKNREKAGLWHWKRNPFSGTRELNGLRVMMALINNWDLKDENNTVYKEKSGRVFLVSDLGASFGTTGADLSNRRAKGNLRSFRHSKFIVKVTSEFVDFEEPARPSFFYVFNPWRYGQRLRLVWIGRHIPRADAKWTGRLLSQLSSDQIRDAFRAAGYSREEVEGFSQVVEDRIAQLNGL
jgi:hypothetical protein